MDPNEPFLAALARLGGGGGDAIDRLIETAPYGVFLSMKNQGCVYANPRFCEIFGLSKEACMGFGWARVVHPDDVATLQRDIEVFTEVGEPLAVEYRVVRADSSIRWVRVRVQGVEREGTHAGEIALVDDITEERAFKDQATEHQKLEVVGRLSAQVAHDFNNLLTAMQLGLDLLQGQDLSSADAKAHLRTLDQATEHAAQLTHQLLNLSRRRATRSERVDLDDALRRLRPLLQRTAGEQIRMIFDLAAQDRRVDLDSGQLGQILLNLVINARDALQGAGTVQVTTGARGEIAFIEVTDDGPGIPESMQAQIFQPFFTTKEIGKGTGLGLSTVRELAQGAGGSLSVTSVPGRTTFRCELRAWETSPEEQVSRETIETLGGAGTVLLVDDQQPVRVAVGYVLAMHGYQVLTASSCAEAERVVQDANTLLTVAVIDVLLSDGRGTALAESLRARQPDLRVLFISGFTGETWMGSESLPEGQAFLAKPFRPRALLEAVKSLTHAASTPRAG